VFARVVPWRAHVEPLGFLVFVFALGYIAARRFFANQQQLLAIAQEMSAARQIQSSILPQQPPSLKSLSIAVRYVPMASVAGDFYDFQQGNGRQLGVLVADSVGHGVPAALIASMIKTAFAAQTAQASRPAELLAELNRVFCRLARGQFITAGYLYLDLERRTALYAGAGHPPLLCWRRATSAVQEWEENGLPLGFEPTASYSNLSLELQPGDRILLYTDGIPEASSPAGEFFGEERFRQFLATHTHLPPEPFADALLGELSRWSGADRGRPQEDDLTLVVIDIEG
jgi:serine phosphatase RsbU (regulator of sigma subunit)